MGLIAAPDLAEARAFRVAARDSLTGMLAGGRVMALPTSPIMPILCDARLSEMCQAVHDIVDLPAIAGLAGLPQVSVPGNCRYHSGGLSFIDWPGSDAQLLGMARALEPHCLPR